MKYRNHSSINPIHLFLQRNSSFYFSPVDKNTVLKEIKRFSAHTRKRYSYQSFERKCKLFAEQITLQFNEGICSSKYAESFKLVNITHSFKQGSRNLKDNYRPISILAIISKLFEKFICKQLSNHFDKIFSKFQCGF